VSPISPTIKGLVISVEIAKKRIKLVTIENPMNSRLLKTIGISLYELIKCPEIHPLTNSKNNSLAELNGS
jgi:hypothetical protein